MTEAHVRLQTVEGIIRLLEQSIQKHHDGTSEGVLDAMNTFMSGLYYERTILKSDLEQEQFKSTGSFSSLEELFYYLSQQGGNHS